MKNAKHIVCQVNFSALFVADDIIYFHIEGTHFKANLSLRVHTVVH